MKWLRAAAQAVILIIGAPFAAAQGSPPADQIYPTIPNPSSLASGATGRSLTAAVMLYFSPVVGTHVTFTAQSGCGNFAGASSVDVVTNSGGIATTPPFTAGSPSTCTITATLTGYSLQTTFTIYIYDAATVQITANPPSVSVTASQAFGPLTVTVKDAGQRPLVGYIIDFLTQDTCGRFVGVPNTDALTSNLGVAQTVTFTGAQFPTQCSIDVSVHVNPAIRTVIPVQVTATSPSPSPPTRIDVLAGANQIVAFGQSAYPLSVRLSNAAGGPAIGSVVTFSTTPSCGSFGGQSSMNQTTNIAGEATQGSFVAASVMTGSCAIQVIVPGTALQASIPIYVYSPAAVTLTPLPPFVTVTVGQNFTFSIDVQVNSIPLAGLDVQFAANSSSGATPSALQASATTSSLGRATVTATANAVAGQYSIVATYGVRSATIAVTQQAVAPPPPPSPSIQVQDMWWSGPTEDGWGMSIIQHGDVLFAVVYAYDVDGKPTWYTMSGGTWDSSHRAYSGALYAPRGSAYFAYDAARFVAGAPIGNATLNFSDANNATFDYSIDGAAGRKTIMREPLGPTIGLDNRPHADMWWGGSAQDGWGVAIVQQYQSLFSVWFTYDATGARTWFVMPGGTWTSDTTYEGHIYSTIGSPWAGRAYDASKFKVHDAGTYRLRFNGANAILDYVVDGRAATLNLEKQPF
jgi:hypothetical protein